MVKRKRIALIYRVNYDFSAGIVIYIQNLIKGFKLLDDALRPHLTIIYNKDTPIQEVKEIDYPYIDFYLYKPLPRFFITKVINKLSVTLLNTYLYKRYSFPTHVDIIYPYFECPETAFIKNRYYWKPDFQEMYYPEYVSINEYEYVVANMKHVAESDTYTLVVSSQDSLSDFKKFFGPYRNTAKVLRFISLLPEINKLEPRDVLRKYALDKPYFMVSNQFWPHKNHHLVLEAINLIKEKHTEFMIVFSGKQSSYRDKEYFSKLQVFINDNNLKKYVRFIGFVPREEQLVIMKKAIAVIQPSLFEGWSTIIEDCKALNQFVIAGDLAVNQEQIQKNCAFFDRKSPEDLSRLLNDYLIKAPEIQNTDYSANIEEFKINLIKVFNLVS